MEIVKSILTNNPCYKAGKKIAVRGLMIHSVGCPQPSAEGFVKKWNNADYKRACVHAFIDGNTGKVIQTLPWDYRGWHCGGSGNNTHIGVEMCEPACLKYTGGATFTCSDKETAMSIVNRTYHTAVELFAFLCREFGLNPLADGVIVSHKEGHDKGIASGHGDPDHLWKQLDTGYTMDTFRMAIKEAMEKLPGDTPVKEAPVSAAENHTGAENQQIQGDEPEKSVSPKGVELVAKYEGCKLEAYKCPAGVWTIGYGHTANVKEGDTLSSAEEARKLLAEDLKKYAGYVNDFVRQGIISFPLNQNQFDALTSFTYNCGKGNLQKLVSGRDAATVAAKIPAYNKGGGKVLEGLVKRREEERALFLS